MIILRRFVNVYVDGFCLSVWEYEVGQTRSYFSNNNPSPTNICCMEFANVSSDPLLIVGSGSNCLFFADVVSCKRMILEN